MATVIDLLRSRGLGAGPGGAQALRGPIVIAAEPARAMALAMPSTLVDAWTAVSGRPTEARHAVALAASRAGDTIACIGHGQATHDDLLLLTMAYLSAAPSSIALWLAPDARSARNAAVLWEALAAPALSWQVVAGRSGRPLPSRVVITTFDDMHQRLLGGAERGWRWLWPHLSLIVVPDLQRASGAAGAHLRWLIRRVQRLAEHDPRILVGSTPIAEPEEALGRLLGQPVHIVASEAPNNPVLVTLWHSGDRWSSVRMLAAELLARRLGVTVLGRDEYETEALRDGLASLPAAVIGLPPDKARIAIVCGVPRDPDTLSAVLRRGYRLLVMVAADEPFETLCVEQPATLVGEPRAFPVAPGNAYVGLAHLQWAASEAPLQQPELDHWGAQSLVDLLLDQGLLRAVAGEQIQPGDAGIEHSLDLVTATIDEPPLEVRDPDDLLVARLLPHVADWWAVPGTPWLPGWTIGEHDADATSAALVPAPEVAVVVPLLRVELSPRDEAGPFPARVGARTLAVTRAKVQIKQRIEGHIVYRPGEPPRPMLLDRSRMRTWNAHACAIDVPVVPAEPLTAGWALGLALPYIVHLARGDALIVYDTPTHAIWIVETHPGGTGLVACIANEVPRLFTTAVALARAALSSPIYRALARSELEWLDPLHRPDELISIKADPTSHLTEGGGEPISFPPVPQTEELAPLLIRGGDYFEEVALEDLAAKPPREAGPDVQALLKGIRHLREQHEQESTVPRQPAAAVDVPVAAARFRPGQRVRCVPYGEGTVQDARVVDGREQLTITFADAGDIDVDPAVNMVRVLDEVADHDDPWDPQIF